MDFGLTTELFPNEYRYRPTLAANDKPMIDLVQVIQGLHMSLDPRTVFACYGNVLGQHLPVMGVDLSLAQQEFSWGSPHGISMSRYLDYGDRALSLNYKLQSLLTQQQLALLQDIEALLLQPLLNAVQYQAMSTQAMFDSLTGLGNRHYYQESVKTAVARSQRNLGQVSLVILDLDNFKQLNDCFGHACGDSILKVFGELLNESIRNTDQAFRIGGDEFVVLVQGDAHAAAILCERIISKMLQQPLLMRFEVKASLGVAQLAEEQEHHQLYELADRALYQAKAAGRNCYRVSMTDYDEERISA
ncbi:GGDEF domain-containing protein [Shewanella sp. AS16]|uniref:diguanylate cyclase DgcS n=1 Tax=Shewanella sp. AS16 TaxID=2907625 RepID=UPI001F3CB017|nr:GGDEF domain-containing protein [Shewanella sp. AS16]MCE9685089.1 GGDEF domain-containing protein [Shewanella sp. AS16]